MRATRSTFIPVIAIGLLVGSVVGGIAQDAEPPGSEAPAGSTDANGSAPRVIDLEMTAAVQFEQDGGPVLDVQVMPGETVVFRVNNAAGIKHNFYIGTDEELTVPFGTTSAGIPDWIRFGDTREGELAWTVPEDIAGLKFGCTIPGHYETMQGTFSVAGESEPSIVGDPGVVDVEPKDLCDPSDTDAPSCRSDALATTVAEFEERYSALVRDQSDAWRAGDDIDRHRFSQVSHGRHRTGARPASRSLGSPPASASSSASAGSGGRCRRRPS